MKTQENKCKPASLLEIDDSYVQATWRHPQASTEIIGIYRLNPDEVSWSLSQPIRGPWSVIRDGKVVNDHTNYTEAYNAASVHAMALFELLNNQGPSAVKQAWAVDGGTVYDL